MRKPLFVTLLTISMIGAATLTAGLLCRMEGVEMTALADSPPEHSSGEESVAVKTLPALTLSEAASQEKSEPELTASQLYSTDYLSQSSPLYDFVEYYVELALSEPREPQAADGWTKYGAYFGDGYAMWCTEFAIWCISQAEEAFDAQYIGEYFPGYDSAYACSLWNEANGSLRLKGEYVPRRGDLIYFDYDFDGYADHTGLVTDIAYDEEEETLYVLTVEGNLPEDIPNGVIRERRLALDTAVILGYGTFDSSAAGETEKML